MNPDKKNKKIPWRSEAWKKAAERFFFIPACFPVAVLLYALNSKSYKYFGLFVINLLVMIVAILLIYKGIHDPLILFFIGIVLFSIDWGCASVILYFTEIPVKDPEPIFVTGSLSAIPDSPVNKVEAMGRTLVTNLRKWKKEIESVPLQNDIEELVQICLIVMKRNDVEAWKFFTTYADKLELMLSKYDEIENTRINSPEMLHTMGLIEKSISEIVVAFRNEVNEMYKKDMIDLNAETKAFMYNLRNKGLIG